MPDLCHLWPLPTLLPLSPTGTLHFANKTLPALISFCSSPLSLIRAIQNGLMCDLLLGDHLV